MDDGALDLEFWDQSFSFICNDKLWLFSDLDDGPDGALDWPFWRRSFSFIPNDKLWLFLDLDDGALNLSFWSWAFGPACFLMRKSIVSGLGHSSVGLVTPALELSFGSWAFDSASFLQNLYMSSRKGVGRGQSRLSSIFQTLNQQCQDHKPRTQPLHLFWVFVWSFCFSKTLNAVSCQQTPTN